MKPQAVRTCVGLGLLALVAYALIQVLPDPGVVVYGPPDQPLIFVGGFLGGLVKGIGRVVGGVVKPALSVASSLIPGGSLVRAGVSAVAGAIGGQTAVARALPPMLPAIPSLGGMGNAAPTFAPMTPQIVPHTPQPGVMGAVRRVLPGGRSGYTFDPYDLNTPSDRFGRPAAVHLEVRQRAVAPRGYVTVDLDGDGVKDAAVLKGVARALGLYKPRPRPPVTGYEARAVRTAKAVKGRVAKLARSTGLHVSASKPRGEGRKGRKR